MMRILELEEAQEVEETPDLLAAVDEGLRSLEDEPTFTPDDFKVIITQAALNDLEEIVD